MKVLAIFALLLAASEAVRKPVPYNVYVKNGGLPLPDALRHSGMKWYLPDDEPSNNTFIVGGSTAAAGDAPWIVSIRRTSHFCGGSIINSRAILTAAHCIDGQTASSLQIRYNTLQHGSGGTLVSVSSLVRHGSYNPSTIDHDIGLLRLSADLSLGGTQARAVSLPAQGSDPSSGTSVLIAGWGTTSSGGSTLPANLLKVTTSIVSRTTCQQNYGSSSITGNMVCAGETNGGKDACQGDSGGPMTAGNTLVGVVSWGRGCALAGYPGVYTRVGNYITWINANA